jgi:hypothetical protein
MRRASWLLVVGVVLLAGCGTPETRCRDGVAQMKKRTSQFVGMGQPEDVRKSLEAINNAETQLATGAYEGCLTSLEEAAGHLRASQRTNQ